MSFITGWLEEKATGYLKTGIQAGGTLAGNAVGGVGSLVESAGRSGAGGVTGGVSSVGNSIKGYGDTVKGSMSADGPVSGVQKKTAVKPSAPTSTATKALPSTGGAQKSAQPSVGGVQKPVTSGSQRPATGGAPKSKPATQYPKPNVGGQKPPGSSPGAAARTATGAPVSGSNVRNDGKKTVSAASRPQSSATKPAAGRPTAGSTAKSSASSKPQQSGNILGIGDNFGSMGGGAKK